MYASNDRVPPGIVIANGQQDGYSAPTLPANASVGPTWQLSNKTTSTGATFKLKTCNSTSLGLSPSVQSSCSHSGCYHTYTDYVQIINPYTGHCLTTLNYKANATKLGFQACDAAATTMYQLFETDQQVLYTLGYQQLTSYGNVDFNPINLGQPPDPPFQAWTLANNYKDIELILYDYTQAGLFAVLE